MRWRGIAISSSKSVRRAVGIGVLSILFIVCLGSFCYVRVGRAAVVVHYGKVQDEELTSGWHRISPFSQIHTFSIRSQVKTLAYPVAWSNGQSAVIHLTVVYHPHIEALSDRYRDFVFNEEIIDALIEEALLLWTSTKRDLDIPHTEFLKDKELLQEDMNTLFLRFGMEVDDVVIRSIFSSSIEDYSCRL